jgi:hypothetical protein
VSDTRGHAAVNITTHPLWRLRLARGLPRLLLSGLALAGVAASARFAIAPPGALPATGTRAVPTPPDRAAEGYATLFARRYLSWGAAESAPAAQGLGGFVGPGMEPAAGLVVPSNGAQSVQWVEVVQVRERAPGEHLYTVAAQTDTAGLLYLVVAVERTGQGRLALAGYPAFVGPPASGPAPEKARRREVADQALVTVVTRALRNYLAGNAGELAADLSAAARVSVPALALTLDSTERLDWASDGRSVVAVAQAHDARGAQYTLEYELDVEREQGRWEVSAVEMDPYE